MLTFFSIAAPAAGKKYLTFTVDYQFPFSRGSIVRYLVILRVAYLISTPSLSTFRQLITPFSQLSTRIIFRRTLVRSGARPTAKCSKYCLPGTTDLEVLVAGIKFGRKLATTGGFASVLGAEADPGPAYQTDDQIKGVSLVMYLSLP